MRKLYFLVFIIMTFETYASEDVWDRKYYSKSSDSPFLFYVIFGVVNSELTLSKSKHNIDEFPDALDIRFYSKNGGIEEIEYIDGFLTGTFGDLLKSKFSSLFELSKNTQSIAVVSGTFKDTNSLGYLKNTIGVIKSLSEKGALSILDVQTTQLFSVNDWSSIYFEKFKPMPYEHVVIYTSNENGALWVHTRGMRTFGRPDISLRDWPKERINDAQELINRFIEMFAFGSYPESGKEIFVTGLPTGMISTIEGGHDNLDFNNYYLEIKWLR